MWVQVLSVRFATCRLESRYAGIMKAAIQQMNNSAPQGAGEQDVSMEPETWREGDLPPAESDASMPVQPPVPSFSGAGRQPAAATAFERRAARADPSHPVAPFPKPFAPVKPLLSGASAPAPDLPSTGPSRTTPTLGAEAAQPMDFAQIPSDAPPSVPFPLHFGASSAQSAGSGGGAAGSPAPGSTAAARNKSINPFSPASQSKIRVQRSPHKAAVLNALGKQPLFGAGTTANGAGPTPPTVPAASAPSFEMFSAGSSSAGVPLQPTSPPILAFTATRQPVNRSGSVNDSGVHLCIQVLTEH